MSRRGSEEGPQEPLKKKQSFGEEYRELTESHSDLGSEILDFSNFGFDYSSEQSSSGLGFSQLGLSETQLTPFASQAIRPASPLSTPNLTLSTPLSSIRQFQRTSTPTIRTCQTYERTSSPLPSSSTRTPSRLDLSSFLSTSDDLNIGFDYSRDQSSSGLGFSQLGLSETQSIPTTSQAIRPLSSLTTPDPAFSASFLSFSPFQTSPPLRRTSPLLPRTSATLLRPLESLPSSSTQTQSSIVTSTVFPPIFAQIQGLDHIDHKSLRNIRPNYFEFLQTIGTGASSYVYRAKQYPSRKIYAIKVIKLNVGNGTLFSIDNEKQITERLLKFKHKNIIKFRGLINNSKIGRLYIISELSPIGDLFNAVQIVNNMNIRVWEPLSELECRHLITGIAEGLQHMHKYLLCHGDIKLDNILLFPNMSINFPEFTPNDVIQTKRFDRWIPKLIDFSNSRMKTQSDPPGTIISEYPLCTITSASPESYETELRYDAIKADVYSLGSCLLSLLLGAFPHLPPFPMPNTTSPHYNHWIRYIIFLKKDINHTRLICKPFPPTLRELLSGALNPIPNQRISLNQFISSEWMNERVYRRFEDVSYRLSYNTPKIPLQIIAKDF